MADFCKKVRCNKPVVVPVCAIPFWSKGLILADFSPVIHRHRAKSRKKETSKKIRVSRKRNAKFLY